MTRLLAIPATWSAIVVVPILIGKQASGPAPAREPRQAALVVKVSGDLGRSKPLPLLVRASGTPPASTTLKSADGLHTATVSPGTDCTDVPVRSTAYDGTGASDWCLTVTGLPPHDEVAGVIKTTAAGGAAATELTLTIDHRDALRWRPAAAIAAGLAGSVLITLLLSGIAALIRGNRLDRLLARNSRAAPDKRITGLTQWVATRREFGDTDETLLGIVMPVVNYGPGQARRLRGELRAKLDGAALPASIPLVEAARAEEQRTTNLRSDFIDDEGNKAPHPATTFANAIDTLAEYTKQLDEIESEIAKLKPTCQKDPTTALAVARVSFSRQSSADSFDELEEAVDAADAALVAKLADPNCVEPEARAAAAAAEGLRRTAPSLAPSVPADLGTVSIARLVGFALGVATGAMIAVAVGFAAVIVYVATYAVNATFGTWQDYFKLVSAALAAGAAATVSALLAPWREGVS